VVPIVTIDSIGLAFTITYKSNNQAKTTILANLILRSLCRWDIYSLEIKKRIHKYS